MSQVAAQPNIADIGAVNRPVKSTATPASSSDTGKERFSSVMERENNNQRRLDAGQQERPKPKANDDQQVRRNDAAPAGQQKSKFEKLQDKIAKSDSWNSLSRTSAKADVDKDIDPETLTAMHQNLAEQISEQLQQISSADQLKQLLLPEEMVEDLQAQLDKLNVEAGEQIDPNATQDTELDDAALKQIAQMLDTLRKEWGGNDKEAMPAELVAIADRIRTLIAEQQPDHPAIKLDDKDLLKQFSQAMNRMAEQQANNGQQQLHAQSKEADEAMDEIMSLLDEVSDEDFADFFNNIKHELARAAQNAGKHAQLEKMNGLELAEQMANQKANEGLDRAAAVQGMNNMNPATRVAGAAPAATTPAFQLEPQLQDPEWNSAFSQRVAMMVRNNMQSAELRLNPPELGSVNVRINISNDQANVVFHAPAHAAREAIEAALPRLREMLAEDGLSLANVDVESQFKEQQQDDFAGDTGSGFASSGHDDGVVAEGTETATSTRRISLDSLVDTYA
jgi:flagellar hook-length control protein FliK